MEDPLLAAHLQSLLDKLAPGPLMDFAIQEGFDSELRKWRSMLRKIKPVLGDAEQKQMNDREVKRWLHDLLVLAYDADDALDDLGCEALQQQNNSSSAPATSCSQLPDMLPLIKKITARFQDIEEQKSDLELDAKHGVRSSIINKRSETTSLLDTSEIVGRENDVEAILKLMRLSETTKAKAHASHTFGMAGSGSVGDAEDAFVINLMSKKNIEKLKFGWLRDADNNGNAERQFQILNLLEPGKMLRNLVIRRYRGVTLPNWIGDSSYSELVELSLIDCKRCKLLPSLGQLPQLQKLTIEGMLEIETMGTELYGEASPHGQPFPSLTELRIKSCKNLRTLPDGIMSSNSNLQVLEIRDCKSLESLGSGVLPSTLKELSIMYCRKLESIGEIPCNLQKLTSLKNLCVVGCDNLVSLTEGGLPPSIQDLEFGACAKVEKQMWDECAPAKLPFLTHLCIDVVGCESIESFPETPNLAHLTIRGCNNLKYLPSNLQRLTSLQYIYVDWCYSIESFPFLETPNLAHLEIHYCKNLKYLPSNLPKLTSLLYLRVLGCDNLVSLPEGGLPPGLQDLVFVACAKVEKQMWDEWAPYNLPCLTSLSIEGDFRDVVCFPIPAQESQSRLPPSLTSLSIKGFSNLESLSSSAFRNLTSLAELRIRDCPKLQTLPIEALPPSLRLLDICKCPELTPKCEKGGEYWPSLSLIHDAWII
ncbi:Rx, N-terminal [Dillenia turbinata]|uniref:Rx, N-terminal n=1 Tax=Dillenia turbinata TaxID=194707 RepID=A0AAN8VPM9_9MAGN